MYACMCVCAHTRMRARTHAHTHAHTQTRARTQVSYLSLKPLGSWFKDLVARVDFMTSWIENGPPDAYWMSAFFFPQVRLCHGVCVCV